MRVARACVRALPLLSLTVLNALIVWPYATLDLSGHAGGNELGYVSIARLFRDHPWTWNAWQYCGAPFRYLYPPVFHALVAWFPASIGHSFHVIGAVAYCATPAALYILAVELFDSRLTAFLAAGIYSVGFSPVYALIPAWRAAADSMGFAPLGFISSVKFDEAPHTLALALSLLTIAFAWRSRWVACSLCGALVPLCNIPGAIGLAMMLLALGLAQGRIDGYPAALLRSFTAGAAWYGLSAFWLTPGFLVTTALASRVILRHVDKPAVSYLGLVPIIALAGSLLVFALKLRIPPPVAFLLSWFAICGAVVASANLLGIAILPLAERYVLEFNIAAVLLAGSAFTYSPGKWRLPVSAAIIVCLIGASARFWLSPYRLQKPETPSRQLAGSEVAQWLSGHGSPGRVFASGEFEQSLNAWTDYPQAGGSFAGMSNLAVVAATKELEGGCGDARSERRIGELWLRALGATYVVASDASSSEYFHWLAHPERFDGLPVAWTNGRGDVIYRVGEQDEAVVVDLAALGRIPKLRSTADLAFLRAYTDWAKGRRPARAKWSAPGDATIEADVDPGEGILIKQSFDRGWTSPESAIEPDPIGFMLLRPVAGPKRIALHFGMAWDVWAGVALTAITLLSVFLPAPFREGVPIFGVLMTAVCCLLLWKSASLNAFVAEAAFSVRRPPLLAPGGVVRTGASNLSIYGAGFGKSGDDVSVWIGGRKAPVLYRSERQVNAALPSGIDENAVVSVEVNHCLGNGFLLGPMRQ